MAQLTNTIIQAAIDGFEAQKRTIDAEIAELRAMLADTAEGSAGKATETGTRRKFSAASREKMRKAQQLRWAKVRGEAPPLAQAPAPAAKPKRKLSAATRAALAANLKKARAAKAAKANGMAAKRTAPPVSAPKPKRKLSAAGRAAISATTKKMWAAKRAAAA